MTEDLTQQNVKTLVVNIRGMHCSHCEVLIERKLSAIPSVQWVDVSFRKGLARIIHWGNVDTTAVQNTVEEEGYTRRKSTRLNSSHIQKSRMPSSA